MGHHDPDHLATDLDAMARLHLDDVLVAIQEVDFFYEVGKVQFTPTLAKERGIRPLAITWGLLNCFGGGRSSQFLLKNPTCFQQTREGTLREEGCYVNPASITYIKQLIDTLVEYGYEGYFIDEPTVLDCFCPACQDQFQTWYGHSLIDSNPNQQHAFRKRCVLQYIDTIAHYCMETHPQLETQCCLMPSEQDIWYEAARIPALKNLGTDIYWVNNTRSVEEMTPMVRELSALCKEWGKIHHEWLQCWDVKAGNEHRIREQGKILVREKPDALYIWAYNAQRGMSETCDNPMKAWAEVEGILREAKGA